MLGWPDGDSAEDRMGRMIGCVGFAVIAAVLGLVFSLGVVAGKLIG